MNLGADTIARYSLETLFERISEGIPPNGMPGWKGSLTVKERKSIVYHIRRQFQDVHRGS